jgi:hypothetical protein
MLLNKVKPNFVTQKKLKSSKHLNSWIESVSLSSIKEHEIVLVGGTSRAKSNNWSLNIYLWKISCSNLIHLFKRVLQTSNWLVKKESER